MGDAAEGFKNPKRKIREFRKKARLKLGLDQPEIEVPELPELPEQDSEAELIRARALAERIRRATFKGAGRAATIFTSPLGVIGPTPVQRASLQGI
jgi:hypothetical protein